MTIQEILWCSWNIYLGKNSPPFLGKVPKCPSRNLMDIWEDPSSYFWKSGCDVKEVEIEASGQRREGGGRKENRQQLERPNWMILKKKKKPTASHTESSHFTPVEKSTEQRRISTDRLCLDEKQNQQKALLMQEGMHQKRFSPSQSPALLSNIFNAEQCPQTTKHCSWTFS